MDFLHDAKRLQGKTLPALKQLEVETWGLVNIELRSHQLEGIKWLAEKYESDHGCILGDEMGLGKTLQSIGLILYLNAVKNILGPFLILCPLSVVNGWEAEFQRATPHIRVLNYCSSKEERQQIQQDIQSHVTANDGSLGSGPFPFDVLLAHYEVVLKDTSFLQKIHWRCLIVDEGHRLKNSESLLYQCLRRFNIDHTLLLTGTPVQNNLKELYSLVSFVSPKVFPLEKMERFISHFSTVDSDSKLSDLLHSILEPFILRRTKSEVLLDLPVKSEVILYTGISAVQRKVYKAVLTKDLSVFGASGSKTSLMNVLMNLRKCVNHPYLFDGVEPEPFELGEHLVLASGKLFILDKLLELLKSKGHRVLVFSQMTRMLDILQDYLGYREYSYERLDGSVRGEERFLAIKNFTESDETFVFLLSTKAGGQGLNLVGADTIVFIDSDFNPQNDLQAAARAHRIGQTKPVKVIRLIAKETVEEIILKRSEAKLSLTQAVIEGGQFSGGVAADSTSQLADILKFGLDKMMSMEDEESNLECEDLESILGQTDDEGRWIMETPPTKMELEEEGGGLENMYMYEGQDYSRSSDKDRNTFDQLLATQLKSSEEAMGERVLRSEIKVPLVPVDLPVARKRKPLTEEQLEERRRKREENRLKRQKLQEEAERRREEERERRKQEWWKKNNYVSHNICIESSEEEEEEEEGEGLDTQYVMGDVTQPQVAGSGDAIIVHCVDNSGRWGKGGVFTAISSRSPKPEKCYKIAGKMKDLSLGDVHIVPVDDVMSRDDGRDLLALIVCQSRDGSGHLSGIKFSALDLGLRRIYRLAKRKNASVHLPRIGHSTPHFNWYGTERLIRKHLSSRGVHTSIYYFPRHGGISSSRGTGTKLDVDTPSTATSSKSDTPADTSLSNIFSGVVVYFHHVSAEEVKKFSRYIIAYDGEVEQGLSNKVTHVVCQPQQQSTTPITGTPEGVALVGISWLQDSLSKGVLEDVKEHVVKCLK